MILKFKDFILETFYPFDKEPKTKEVPSKQMPILWKDDNLEVRVVKTFAAAQEQGKGTNWCSNREEGFFSHFLTANMYRFNFKDGYKLRLTWDYIPQTASELGHFSGGTHWGQGGYVNGISQDYLHIRPRNEMRPFDFDYQKRDERGEMVRRILSIPKEAKEAVEKYQDKNSEHKTKMLNNLYSEIEKIKVVNVNREPNDVYDLVLEITIKYLNQNFDITFYLQGQKYYFSLNKLDSKFRSKFHRVGSVMSKYLFDKTMEFLKRKGDKELLADIKYVRTGKDDSELSD